MEFDWVTIGLLGVIAVIFSFMFRMLKITRSQQHKKIAGVCSGLSVASGMPVWQIRSVFIIFTAFWGFGITFYISLWLFMLKGPKESKS